MLTHVRPLSTVLALVGALLPARAGLSQTTDPLGSLGGATSVVIPQTRSFRLTPETQGVQIDSVEARVEILEQTARTTLEISLVNTSGRRDDAIVLLPVPRGAVVSGFAFQGTASEPTWDILLADDARRLYDALVGKILDPALLEFAGYNLIRSSVFPVAAYGTQKVQVTYEHLLAVDGPRVDYVLARSESLKARRPWQISVEITSADPISTVYSPTHEILSTRLGPGRLTVSLAEAASLEPGSFLLSYLREREGVTSSLFSYPDPSVGGGFFLLVAGLPADVDETANRLNREVTIVIDRSGSMAGVKMDQARAAALKVIEDLEDGEAFNVIDYASSIASFAPRPVRKNPDTLRTARRYLASIRPAGGTNIHDALLEALGPEPLDGTLPIVLFLTDGLPTIGRTSESDIRRMVEQANCHGRRVFTFGVGQDVNVPLLDRIADVTRATATYVLPGEDVQVKVARVFKRLNGPVLAEPTLRTLDADGVLSTRLAGELIPADLPDLFEGDQLIVLGQYRQRGPITFHLEGNFLGRPRTFSFTFDTTKATTRHAFVPRLWATRQIASLVDQIRQAGADSPGTGVSLAAGRWRELVDEIVRLSTTYGILTEYTSFLAREGTDLSDFRELALGCSRELDEKALRTRWGAGAVSQGINYNRKKAQVVENRANKLVNERLELIEFTAVQQLCDRAFFRRGNRWIDSRLLAVSKFIEPHQVLMIGSEPHFQLLRKLERQGRQGVLSLSGEILLEVDGRAILITDGC